MNSSRKKNELWQIVWPTKDLLRLWLTPSQLKAPIFAGKRGNLLECGENSKELLLAREVSGSRKGPRNPTEVPKGFLAVYVGPELRRYVIPATCLSLPEFRVLMERSAEDFGFEQEGGLRIPCDEEDFEEILLRCLAKHQKKMTKKNKERA